MTKNIQSGNNDLSIEEGYGMKNRTTLAFVVLFPTQLD